MTTSAARVKLAEEEVKLVAWIVAAIVAMYEHCRGTRQQANIVDTNKIQSRACNLSPVKLSEISKDR